MKNRKLFGIEQDLWNLWKQDLSVDELIEEICNLAEDDKFFYLDTPYRVAWSKELQVDRFRLTGYDVTRFFWAGFDDGIAGRMNPYVWRNHKPMLEFLYLAGREMALRHPEWQHIPNHTIRSEYD